MTGTTLRPAVRLRITWRWRVVDIVVASVLGVAIAVIFLAWNVAYVGPAALLTPLLPGVQGLVNGPWMLAGVVGGLVVRKPGAALYTELLAAVVSALIGTQWGGLLTLASGVTQGLGAELVFLLFLYGGRAWLSVLAGAGAGLLGAGNDLLLSYFGAGPLFATVYVVSSAVSGAILGGLVGWLLVRALATTGVLDRFPAGRARRADA